MRATPLVAVQLLRPPAQLQRPPTQLQRPLAQLQRPPTQLQRPPTQLWGPPTQHNAQLQRPPAQLQRKERGRMQWPGTGEANGRDYTGTSILHTDKVRTGDQGPPIRAPPPPPPSRICKGTIVV